MLQNPLQTGIQPGAELSLLQQDRLSLAATFLTVPSSPGCAFLKYHWEGYLKIQSQPFLWQIFSTSFVPVRNLLETLLSPSNFFFPILSRYSWHEKKEWWDKQCLEQSDLLREAEHSFCGVGWCFLLCESDENSLVLFLHCLFRLHSKVTRQNAIPNHYRSPLPVPAGLSLLPDTRGLKLLSSLLCSEYPSPAPLVFTGSLLVAPWCFPLHPQNLGRSQNKTRGWGESEPGVCKRDGESRNWALHISQS